jgi:hypothetical protein
VSCQEVVGVSRVEYVLIGTDDSFDVVSARIGDLLAVAPDVVGGEHVFRLPEGGWAVLDSEPFDAWTDERFSGYRWQLSVGGLNTEGVEAQESAAKRLFERLSAGTPWALALTFDHADALVAARSAQPPRAGRKA